MTAEQQCRKGNIVVIDDTPANLRLLAGMLTKEGHKVRPMPNGELGLKTVLASPPDLILLDINMPGMDGYEVCRELKANPKTHNIPILFISALDEAIDKVKAFNAGGVDYITKPFQIEEVQARILTQLDLKYSRDTMESLNQDLKKSLEEKTEFLEILVHELKNPLNVLMGYSDLMVEEQSMPRDEMRSVAVLMAQTSRKMHELVVKILEVNRLELGKRNFNRRPVDLDEVIQGVIANFRGAADRKGIEIAYERGRAPHVMGDESCFYSIFENLVSNAVKFSNHETKVSLALYKGEGCAHCSVTDSGPGFTAEDRGRLFGKYSRLSAKPTGGETSTGLGLSIVKALIDGQGGSIRMESVPGKGATFHLEFPAL